MVSVYIINLCHFKWIQWHGGGRGRGCTGVFAAAIEFSFKSDPKSFKLNNSVQEIRTVVCRGSKGDSLPKWKKNGLLKKRQKIPTIPLSKALRILEFAYRGSFSQFFKGGDPRTPSQIESYLGYSHWRMNLFHYAWCRQDSYKIHVKDLQHCFSRAAKEY